jgi:hypothetical protein
MTALADPNGRVAAGQLARRPGVTWDIRRLAPSFGRLPAHYMPLLTWLWMQEPQAEPRQAAYS